MKSDALTELHKRLWDSLEMSHVRQQLVVWTVGFVAGIAICCLLDTGVPKLNLMLAVLVSVVFAPFLVFWLVRAWRVFQDVGEYVLCSTELTQPHHAPLVRNMFTFCGVIETERAGRFLVETNAIFAGRGVIQPLMEDYLGKTVTVAWNQTTHMVVVIG